MVAVLLGVFELFGMADALYYAVRVIAGLRNVMHVWKMTVIS